MPDAYRKAYAESLEDPLRFWARAADAVEWMRRPRMILDDTTPPVVRWFPGGMLNTCSNALDLLRRERSDRFGFGGLAAGFVTFQDRTEIGHPIRFGACQDSTQPAAGYPAGGAQNDIGDPDEPDFP